MMPTFATASTARKRDDFPVDAPQPELVRSPKRRKKDIMNAFQSISLWKNNPSGCDLTQQPPPFPSAIHNESSQNNVLPPEFPNILRNHSENDEILELEDDDDQSIESDDIDGHLLSDREEVERKVMLDLVYGSGTAIRKHPADVKVEEWVRRDAMIRQQKQQEEEEGRPSTQDDMCLDHMSVYHRSTGNSSYQPDLQFARRIQRSNSLPNMELEDAGADSSMETS
jgi:hypothetical protein